MIKSPIFAIFLFATVDWQGIASVIAAIGSAVAAIYAAKTRYEMSVVRQDVRKVELATNSMKDQLVKSTGIESHARGVLEGRAAEKLEQETKKP